MRIGTLLVAIWLMVTGGAMAQESAGVVPCGDGERTPETCGGALSVKGATPRQESLLREELRIVQPKVLPLRIIFVPHWKYLYTAKVFRLHVPTGMSSVMFTHLASRTVFIDEDHILSDDALTHCMAHELGHLATNSTKEEDAERAAAPYRARLREATKQARL